MERKKIVMTRFCIGELSHSGEFSDFGNILCAPKNVYIS